MRARLEREQGDSNPLKAGTGGYYDIDFAPMYLRLKSAGIFFKVLNTPERIDVIEQMGHLDRRTPSSFATPRRFTAPSITGSGFTRVMPRGGFRTHRFNSRH